MVNEIYTPLSLKIQEFLFKQIINLNQFKQKAIRYFLIFKSLNLKKKSTS